MASADAGEDRIVRRVDMAIGTARAVVRNPEIGMVENRAQPSGGYISGVASDASGRIIRRDVIWDGCAISLSVREIRLVAAIAIRRWIAGGVIAANMAVGARIHHRPNRAGNGGTGRKHMGSLQRKSRRAVIKFSIRPQNRVMAR